MTTCEQNVIYFVNKSDSNLIALKSEETNPPAKLNATTRLKAIVSKLAKSYESNLLIFF